MSKELIAIACVFGFSVYIELPCVGVLMIYSLLLQTHKMQGSLHHFMSKWMDATMHCSVFHLQNKHFDGTRPPSFFDHDGLNKLNLTRERKRHTELNSRPSISGGRRLKSVYDCEKEYSEHATFARSVSAASAHSDSSAIRSSRIRMSFPSSPGIGRPSISDSPGLPSGVREGFWDVIAPTPDNASSDILERTERNTKSFPSSQLPNQNFATRPEGRTPPVFLQELAHLSSLACAVALSTLRNDIELSESPLDMYVPGSEWPASDPDKLPKHIRHEFQHSWRIITILRHWFGADRSPHWRTKYNTARPLSVIGGLSNAEIVYLQKARGPYAKTQLAIGWLKEFIIREHLEGSMGEVHSAIISRLVQFISDGNIYYNHARKVMYIPFPFPHAQLSAFFSGIMVFAIPFLMDQYTNVLWIGSLLSFMTVTCLVGLHEVARELENPFRNVPNELPLPTLLAMYNESLVTMFSGYNPDSFWDAEMYQGVLEARAMGRLYQTNTNDKGGSAGVETILSMPVLKSPDVEVTSNESEKRKSVTFSSEVQTNVDAAKELRGVLAKQALDIVELERLLDEQDKSQSIGESSPDPSPDSSCKLPPPV